MNARRPVTTLRLLAAAVRSDYSGGQSRPVCHLSRLTVWGAR